MQDFGGKLMSALSHLGAALACLLASAATPTAAQTSPQLPQTRALLLSGNFAALDSLYDKLGTAATPDVRDEEMPSVQFFHSMQLGLVPGTWTQDNQVTLAWLKQSPASVPAALARAYALDRHADRLDRARDWGGAEAAVAEGQRLLLAVQTAARKDITWHHLNIGLARQQGWPAARVRSAVQAGLDIDPRSLSFTHSAAIALTPDWRGSAEPLDWLAREAAARVKPAERAARYALLRIWTADRAEVVYRHPFEQGKLDWTLMNEGLSQMYVTNAHQPVLNEHAALACRARDRATTLALLARIGTKDDPRIWKRWGGVSHFDNCKNWVGLGAVRS